jgi:hypothetical protein
VTNSQLHSLAKIKENKNLVVFLQTILTILTKVPVSLVFPKAQVCLEIRMEMIRLTVIGYLGLVEMDCLEIVKRRKAPKKKMRLQEAYSVIQAMARREVVYSGIQVLVYLTSLHQ